jgi:signal transduction histidine kinase
MATTMLNRQALTAPDANSLRATFEAIDFGIAVIDDASVPLTWNRRFYTMLDRAGLLVAPFAGKSADEVSQVPLDEAAPGLKGRPEQVTGPGGRVFGITYKMDPAGFHGLLIQLRDMTGQVMDAAAASNAREQADLIEQARSAFVSQVAHHFRTPLHVILGYVDMISESDDKTLDRLTRDTYLQFIRESAAALLLNMNEMMEIIRLQRDGLDIEAEPCDAGQLLGSAVQDALAVFEAEACELDADEAVAASIGTRIIADPRLARRAIAVLLRTSAVLGGGASTITVTADGCSIGIGFRPGRAEPRDVIDSIERGEPVKEISLTGHASGYGIVLAVLLLRLCNAQVTADVVDERDLNVCIIFAPAPSF